jgi:hypothetical protein
MMRERGSEIAYKNYLLSRTKLVISTLFIRRTKLGLVCHLAALK